MWFSLSDRVQHKRVLLSPGLQHLNLDGYTRQKVLCQPYIGNRIKSEPLLMRFDLIIIKFIEVNQSLLCSLSK